MANRQGDVDLFFAQVSAPPQLTVCLGIGLARSVSAVSNYSLRCLLLEPVVSLTLGWQSDGLRLALSRMSPPSVSYSVGWLVRGIQSRAWLVSQCVCQLPHVFGSGLRPSVLKTHTGTQPQYGHQINKTTCCCSTSLRYSIVQVFNLHSKS